MIMMIHNKPYLHFVLHILQEAIPFMVFVIVYLFSSYLAIKDDFSMDSWNMMISISLPISLWPQVKSLHWLFFWLVLICTFASLFQKKLFWISIVSAVALGMVPILFAWYMKHVAFKDGFI